MVMAQEARARHPAIEEEALGQEADLGLDAERVGRAAVDRDRAGGGAEVAEQAAEERGLARAVRPDDADRLAGRDLEADVVERAPRGPAVLLDEAANDDAGSEVKREASERETGELVARDVDADET
jgi:hypothetical protein